MAQPTGISIHPETGNVGIGVVNASSKLQVKGHITPSSCNVFDLGSSQLRFRDLYLSGSTIDLGGTKISRDENGGGIRLEQMVIENAGTGPALKVTQTGVNSIAEFYDDGGVLALKIADGGNVGIGTDLPLAPFHVIGTVQATGFSGSGASITSIDATNVTAGNLAVARGGTNIQSYTIGDIIYATGATALSKLADVATGNALISGGVGSAPAWGKIGLTTHVIGTLGVANGGTGAVTLTANKVLVGNGTTGVLQPTNLHWDNTNSRLGIGNVSPNRPITLAADSIGISMHNSNPGTDPSITNNSIWFYDNNTYPSRVTGGHWANYGSFVDIHANTIEPSMRVLNGKVGIGTTTPIQKLDVQGNINMFGTFFQNSISSQFFRNIDIQTDTTARSFTTAWADGSIWANRTYRAYSKLLVYIYFPCRNSEAGWGGLYTDVQYNINSTGWFSLGSSGYTAIMNQTGQDIGYYTNTFYLPLSIASTFTCQIKFRHKSYEGTATIVTSTDNAQGTANSYGVDISQFYTKIIIVEISN